MGAYKAAAESSIKRSFLMYGHERFRRIAIASGYELDHEGNVLAVDDEVVAFNNLCETVAREFGPLAALSCKTALIKISSQETKDFMERLEEESWKINAIAYDLESSILAFKIPRNTSASLSGESNNICVKDKAYKNVRMVFERPQPVSIFSKKVFS